MSWSSSTGWNGRGWSRPATGGVTPTIGNTVGAAFSGVAANVAYPSGAAVGDLILVQMYQFNATTSTVSWQSGALTTVLAMSIWAGGSLNDSGIFSHVIQDAGDLAHGLDFSGENFGGAQITVIKNAASLTAVGTRVEDPGSGTDNDVTVTGFTPGAGDLGALIAVVNRDTNRTSHVAATGWTLSVDNLATWTFGSFCMLSKFDYAGANVTVSHIANTVEGVAIMLKVR